LPRSKLATSGWRPEWIGRVPPRLPRSLSHPLRQRVSTGQLART
jgi:hypothetical protein